MNHKVLLAAGIVATALGAALVVFVVAGGLDRTTTARLAGSGRQVVTVELIDSYAWFDISPDVIEVAPGTELVLDVVNQADGATTWTLPVSGPEPWSPASPSDSTSVR